MTWRSRRNRVILALQAHIRTQTGFASDQVHLGASHDPEKQDDRVHVVLIWSRERGIDKSDNKVERILRLEVWVFFRTDQLTGELAELQANEITDPVLNALETFRDGTADPPIIELREEDGPGFDLVNEKQRLRGIGSSWFLHYARTRGQALDPIPPDPPEEPEEGD